MPYFPSSSKGLQFFFSFSNCSFVVLVEHNVSKPGDLLPRFISVFLDDTWEGQSFSPSTRELFKKGGEESNAGCREVFPLAGKGSGMVVRLDLVDTTRPAGTVKFSSICDPRARWIQIVHAVYLLGSLFVLLEFFSSIAGLRWRFDCSARGSAFRNLFFFSEDTVNVILFFVKKKSGCSIAVLSFSATWIKRRAKKNCELSILWRTGPENLLLCNGKPSLSRRKQ